MSAIYDLRKAVRDLLLANGWAEGEVLIKRRSKIWNDVAIAIDTSEQRQCLVIGTAKGKRRSANKTGRKRTLAIDVTVSLTLIELPYIDPPTSDDAADEDARWEDTVMLLEGDQLGRATIHHQLEFQDFEDIEDEEYLIRQATFETMVTLSKSVP